MDNKRQKIKISNNPKDQGYIPESMIFHDILVTVYEEGSEYISYFESFAKRFTYQTLAKLLVRLEPDDVLDCTFVEQENIEKIVEVVKNRDIDYILSYSLITKSNILMQTKDYADKHIIYDVLEKKLEVALVEELPLLIYNVNLEGTDFHSVLDILIENKALNLTQLLVSLALSQDKTGFLYEALTPYMEKLNFSMQGVKIYLQSQICFRKIGGEHFSDKSPHGDLVMHPVNHKTFLDIIREFPAIEGEINERLEGKEAQESKKDASKNNTAFVSSIYPMEELKEDELSLRGALVDEGKYLNMDKGQSFS